MVTDVHLHIEHVHVCMHTHSQTPEYRVNLRTEYFIQDGKTVARACDLTTPFVPFMKQSLRISFQRP